MFYFIFQKVLPKWLDSYLVDRLFKVICNCQANVSGSHSNKYVSEIQFGAFLAEALKGTYGEKADLINLFSDSKDGIEVPLGNVYKVIESDFLSTALIALKVVCMK